MPKATSRYHHGDLRTALVTEAVAELDRAPNTEITLRGLAKKVGVSPMAPYAHFDDKEALLDAIAIDGFTALEAALLAARDTVAETADRDEVLSVLASTYVAFGLEHPGLYRVMFVRPAAPIGDPVRNAGERAFRPLLDLFLEKNGDARQTAEIAWSVVHGLTLLTSAGFIQDGPVLQQRIAAASRFLSSDYLGAPQ